MLLKTDATPGRFSVSDIIFATGVCLTGAGVERVGPNQSYPLSSHPDMYEFSWIRAGSGGISDGSNSRRLRRCRIGHYLEFQPSEFIG